MKKFIPLLVIASIFAVSCSEVCVDPVVSVSSNDVQLSVESSENMENSLLPSSVISEELSSVHPLASSLEETTETKTKTAPFFNDKVAIDLSTNSTSFEEVKASFGDILQNMTVDKVYQDNDGVKIGSSKAGGEWKLTFKYQIKSIKYTLRPYSKLVNYPSTYFSTDDLEYSINQVTLNVAGGNDGAEVAPFVEYSMDIYSNIIDIKTISGRAVFGMMELIYLS